MKYKPGWYMPGTLVVASDRKYIVDVHGCWRVYEYLESHFSKKEKK